MCPRKQKLGGLIVNPHQFYIEVVVRPADQENQGDSGETQSLGPARLKQVVQRAPLKGILLFRCQLCWLCFSVMQLFFLGSLPLLVSSCSPRLLLGATIIAHRLSKFDASIIVWFVVSSLSEVKVLSVPWKSFSNNKTILDALWKITI